MENSQFGGTDLVVSALENGVKSTIQATVRGVAHISNWKGLPRVEFA